VCLKQYSCKQARSDVVDIARRLSANLPAADLHAIQTEQCCVISVRVSFVGYCLQIVRKTCGGSSCLVKIICENYIRKALPAAGEYTFLI